MNEAIDIDDMKQKKVSNATYDFFYFFSFKKLGE
jgi:hypothetical protein